MKLYDLLDILIEIESAKEILDIQFSFHTSIHHQELFPSSTNFLMDYTKNGFHKNQFHVPFPPFGFLVYFSREISTKMIQFTIILDSEKGTTRK